MNIQELRTRIDTKLADRKATRQRHRQEKDLLREAEASLGTARTALALAQQVALATQQAAHAKVADIVAQSLAAVFDKPYEFKILFEQKAGRTEASLVFERNGIQIDPMSASGGGVVDVAAFALRLSCLLLSRPPLRRLLVLDEPFKFTSAEFRPRIRDLLILLAKELECQFLIVTHIDELKVGKVIEL